MATPRAVAKRSGSSRGKWFFTGALQIHETIPLELPDPFTWLCEVGHACPTEGSKPGSVTAPPIDRDRDKSALTAPVSGARVVVNLLVWSAFNSIIGRVSLEDAP